MEAYLFVIPIAVYMITMMVLQTLKLNKELKTQSKGISVRFPLTFEQYQEEKHRLWYENFGRQQEIDAKVRAERMPEELKKWFIMVSNINSQK